MIIRTHYSEEELIAFVAGENLEAHDEISRHALECEACGALLRDLRSLVDALADEDLWDEPSQPSDALLEAARAALPGLDETTTILGSLIDEEATDDIRELVSGESTLATLAVLIERGEAELSRRPSFALDLATIAHEVATRLDSAVPEVTRHQKLAESLRLRASALRTLGRFSEAFQALDAAEEALQNDLVTDFDLAQIGYVRATVHREIDEIDEALRHVRSAARTFESFGDRRRHLHARLLEGAIFYRAGHVGDAADVFRSVIVPLREENDLSSLAAAHNNLGQCSIELGDNDAAASNLQQAISIYDELGLEIPRLRARWGLARLLVTAGKPAEACTIFEDVQHGFERRRMPDDVAMLGLDLAEAFILADRPEEARERCKQLVQFFSRASSEQHAWRALAMLRESSCFTAPSLEQVRGTRATIHRRRSETPRMLFAWAPDRL